MTASRNFAGLPLARWAFALRVWGAMMLALYAAFWLELDGASSAGTCVAILALPTRGQALEKAAYRSLATVVGVSASIAITGVFSQTRDLFVTAYAAWLAICVFVANLTDGTRAYGAILSGYTVAIVAVEQIDRPQEVFLTGINRGAAIAVGIAAIAIVNDLLASPDAHTALLADLEAVRRKILAYATGAAGRSGACTDEAARHLGSLVALRPRIGALAAESATGSVRAAAARGCVAALAELVFAVHGVGRAGEGSSVTTERDSEAGRSGRPAFVEALDASVRRGIADLRAGSMPERIVRLPLARSRRRAAVRALGVAFAVCVSGTLLVLSSWPGTATALSLLGIVAGLGSTAPDFKAFALAALVAIPVAVAVSGIILFVVLDGADQFPLLCIAMGGPVIAAALMASSPKPKFKGIGTLVMVFTPVFVSPSNPQKYDPLDFLNQGLLATLAVLLLAFWLHALPSVSDARHRRWILKAAEEDGASLRAGGRRGLLPCEAAFRSADRVAQLASIGTVRDADRTASLDRLFRLAQRELALRRACCPPRYPADRPV